MDAALAFAKNSVSLTYESIPGDVVEVTKRSILDTLGVMAAAGTTEKACGEIVDLVTEAGGRKESTIIGFGVRVPSWMAAFANGSMCHALEYNGTHEAAAMHPTGCSLPAALAVAERLGTVNGRDFITAVALGIDMACRLGLALTKSIFEYGWLTPTLFGPFSSTLTAGKLLELSEEQMANAFGIAVNQAAGSLEAVSGDIGSFRAIFDAFSGKTGVLSALLAQRGISAGKNSLEGREGLFNLCFRGEYNPVALTGDLGIRFEGINISFAPWPAGRASHSYISATMNLVQEHNINPEDVEEIVALVSPAAQKLCEPLQNRRKPKLGIEAKFSLPFVIAVAVVRRKVGVSDFLPEALKDPLVLKIAERVAYRSVPGLGEGTITPGIVEIKTRDGKQYSQRIDIAYGHPLNPFSMEDLVAKFRDCCRYSYKPLSKDKVDQIIKLVNRLEEVEDMGQVIRLLG